MTYFLDENGENLLWTYAGDQPAYWEIDERAQENDDWNDIGQLPGNFNTANFGNGGYEYSVFGLDSDENQITPRSNTVILPSTA